MYAILSVTDFEGWEETLEIMSDKSLLKGIQKGLADMKNDKLHSEEEVIVVLDIGHRQGVYKK